MKSYKDNKEYWKPQCYCFFLEDESPALPLAWEKSGKFKVREFSKKSGKFRILEKSQGNLPLVMEILTFWMNILLSIRARICLMVKLSEFHIFSWNLTWAVPVCTYGSRKLILLKHPLTHVEKVDPSDDAVAHTVALAVAQSLMQLFMQRFWSCVHMSN